MTLRFGALELTHSSARAIVLSQSRPGRLTRDARTKSSARSGIHTDEPGERSSRDSEKSADRGCGRRRALEHAFVLDERPWRWLLGALSERRQGTRRRRARPWTAPAYSSCTSLGLRPCRFLRWRIVRLGNPTTLGGWTARPSQ